jgi:hypothetical protein
MKTEQFPLGEPINRKPPPGPEPVPGRPGWFYNRRRDGEPYYVNPDAPVPPLTQKGQP